MRTAQKKNRQRKGSPAVTHCLRSGDGPQTILNATLDPSYMIEIAACQFPTGDLRILLEPKLEVRGERKRRDHREHRRWLNLRRPFNKKALPCRGGFYLAVVGPTSQNLLHTVLDQGRHSLCNRDLPELRYGCTRVNEPLDFVSDNQELMQTDTTSVAALITFSTAFAPV
jgi:hypothetical protein